MSRWFFIGSAALAAVLAGLIWRMAHSSVSEKLFESQTRPSEAGPLCPWREPEADLKNFFPTATRYDAEIRILSGLRLELAARLGRAPTGDENTLRLYRIYAGQTVIGTVLTGRVKGEFGAIEVVVAVDANQRVGHLRLQRLREPEPVARVLQSPEWRQAFVGKGAESSWRLGTDLPEVPREARRSAEAVVQSVRSQLVLLAAAESALEAKPGALHHN